MSSVHSVERGASGEGQISPPGPKNPKRHRQCNAGQIGRPIGPARRKTRQKHLMNFDRATQRSAEQRQVQRPPAQTPAQRPPHREKCKRMRVFFPRRIHNANRWQLRHPISHRTQRHTHQQAPGAQPVGLQAGVQRHGQAARPSGNTGSATQANRCASKRFRMVSWSSSRSA
jgi:hypothetical protein